MTFRGHKIQYWRNPLDKLSGQLYSQRCNIITWIALWFVNGYTHSFVLLVVN